MTDEGTNIEVIEVATSHEQMKILTPELHKSMLRTFKLEPYAIGVDFNSPPNLLVITGLCIKQQGKTNNQSIRKLV